jgi:Ca2+-transporting ATPase
MVEPKEALERLGTACGRGVTQAVAAQRLTEHGPNELIDRGAKSPWGILWEQVSAIMVLILIAAAGLAALQGHFTEAASILAIVVLFVALGFIQEYRAERAIAALRKLAVPNVRVWRDGQRVEISARDLVPGDLIQLEAGNLVPADVRLVEAVNLRIQEAALTGESEPVEKETRPLTKADLPLGDRRNMGYMGTLVTYGRGQALVVNTGMSTELGKIAGLIQEVKAGPTPLQQKLDVVGKGLALAGGVVALLVMAIGVLSGEALDDMVLTAISVAVAVVPEGLPAVVTFTLALGAQRMLARNALIRKLPAVETLGSVTTICSDKTGTLTINQMTVTVIDVAGRRLDFTQEMAPGGHPMLMRGQEASIPSAASAINLLLVGGALANDAELRYDEETGRTVTIGDPTEGALLVAAEKGGLHREALVKALPRVAELPFDSERKRMTTVHALPPVGERPPELEGLFAIQTPYVVFTKGSVDGLLAIASHLLDDNTLRPMDAAWRKRIEAANAGLARNGMRVLGVCLRAVDTPEATDATESGLTFIGLSGMIDPARPEVKAAVETCNTAGIRPIMITGDHPLTAGFIARDLGITKDERVVAGVELDRMDGAQLAETVRTTSVFARVSPEHKLRIVGALQKQGEVVAMTGDGVNDAPALKKADIGVAMGITGTDVSKEAASMVLRDDNFATIVAAVEEGRVIYDNVRRFVKFSIAGNIGKVAVMLFWPLLLGLAGVATAGGAAVALQPLQLLWLNLMTDGLLGLGLGVEPAEKNAMHRPPVSPRAGIFSGGLGTHAAWVGLLVGAITLGVGLAYAITGRPEWQTMMFTTLALLQVFQAFATRSIRESCFSLGLGGNRLLLVMALVVITLQLIVIYDPILAGFFRVIPLAGTDLLIAVGLGSLSLIAIEIEKLLIRSRDR